MADASYERQHLVAHAAGYISGDGNTALSFGCQLTRNDTGVYDVLLGDDGGVPNDESYTMVEARSAIAALTSVQDVSDTQKRVRTFRTNGTLQNSDIEVKVFKTVSK